ncbi:disease resistance protein RPP4-like [Neltuma alba]|uniref:disease resistance protein RPP4-like n=1 Tax=Neltuma alba TaxID=207710 RepID=UPI0010A4C0B8|nr:disease resistance protein RPP4-like [Prosopis alba]
MDLTISLTLIEGFLILLAIATNKVIRFISPSSLHVNHPAAVKENFKGDAVSVSKVSPPPLPPHIAAAPPATKYDVFLSFRGEDTRHNFATYLYEALCKANIQTFMDHKLHKGEDISPVLLKTIDESEMPVIIFSADYASSTGCLDKLVHMYNVPENVVNFMAPESRNLPLMVSKLFGDLFGLKSQRLSIGTI